MLQARAGDVAGAEALVRSLGAGEARGQGLLRFAEGLLAAAGVPGGREGEDP